MKKPGRPKIHSKPRPFKCGCGNDYMKTKELYKHYNDKHPTGPPPSSYLKKN